MLYSFLLRYGDFLKWRYSTVAGLSWKILLQWMLWGYPYFRKSWTTLDGWNVKNYGINHRFQLVQDFFHPQYHYYRCPNSWMVYILYMFIWENSMKMDENCGYPYFGKPHIITIPVVFPRFWPRHISFFAGAPGASAFRLGAAGLGGSGGSGGPGEAGDDGFSGESWWTVGCLVRWENLWFLVDFSYNQPIDSKKELSSGSEGATRSYGYPSSLLHWGAIRSY